MYLVLTWRNVKRSFNDYLLYAITMVILTSIMLFSNYIAIIGKVEAGFQTESLPILITLILIILVGYINHFVLKQRAKELANYILLGMEQSKLSKMFILEYWIIGVICFIAGSFLGIVFCILFSYFLVYWLNGFEISLLFFVQSFGKTLLYLCIAELFSAVYISKNMKKLQISSLMYEKKKVQRLGGRKQWNDWIILFGISCCSFLGFLLGITFLPEDISFSLISFVAIPLFAVIITFYKWLYQHLSMIRQKRSEVLLDKTRLYIFTQMTYSIQTNAAMNTIFCICLLFSFLSFFTGAIMLQPEFVIFETKSQRWMGILQISLCMIFIVLYFSILSLQHIVEFRREIKALKILSYIGSDMKQLNYLTKLQIIIRLLLPSIMCFVILIIGIPCIDYKLNKLLPSSMNHIVINFFGMFLVCYVTLYLLYFYIIYRMSNCFIEKLKV